MSKDFSKRQGIVCTELQGIQKAASQWLKLSLLPMAPRWGGLGYFGRGRRQLLKSKLEVVSNSNHLINMPLLNTFELLEGQQFKSHQNTDSLEQNG